MSSQIIDTNPTAGSATTQSVRDNFAFAKNEINEHFRMSEGMQTTGGSATAYTATFSPAVVLATGVRVTVKFNAANTGADPTINLNGTGDVKIKRADGDSLVAGEIGINQIGDLIYDDTDSGDVHFKLLSGTDVPTLVKLMLGAMYPIGHILTTVKADNPGDANYFFTGVTFGTWTAYGAGRVLVGTGTGNDGTETQEFANPGTDIGGKYKHTLTQAEMDHNHHVVDTDGGDERDLETTGGNSAGFNSSANKFNFASSNALNQDLFTDNNRGVTGGSVTAHNITQPYIVTNLWKRTA